uniref:Apolipoprotein D n=1 Tax=Astyanax mexicanus TaxID=7994 RepID=A0A3B1KAJ7_ASTMX
RGAPVSVNIFITPNHCFTAGGTCVKLTLCNLCACLCVCVCVVCVCVCVSSADGTVSSIEGTAKAKDPSEPAKLEVSFFEGVPPGNYWVLSTDYDNYTLVYGCTNYLNLFHVEFAWILSRGRSLPKETLVELQDILISNGIKIDTLTSTDQELKRCSAMPQ